MKDARGKLILVTGGARSGKSTFAESYAREASKRVIYIASAAGDDEEMRRRIEAHRQHRPKHFITVEERYYPHLVLEREGRADTFILLDCLTLLLSNHLIKEACREGGGESAALPLPAGQENALERGKVVEDDAVGRKKRGAGTDGAEERNESETPVEAVDWAEGEMLADAAEQERVMGRILEYIDSLSLLMRSSPADVLVVTNEVGMGLVPEYPLGRIFRDLSGKANQIVASRADEVWFTVCGIPQRIK